MDVVTLSAAQADAKRKVAASDVARATLIAADGGWSVVSSRSVRLTTSRGSSIIQQTSRIECVANTDIYAVEAIYGNWYASTYGGENPFPNAIQVRGEVQLKGSTINEASSGNPVLPLSFGGRDSEWIRSGGKTSGRSAPVFIAAGTRFFIKTHVSACVLAVPSAPACAGSTSGGTLAAGTWTISVSYVYPNNMETAGSATTATGTTGSTSSITVTAPTAATGAIGYRVYASAVGTASPQYQTDSGVLPFGTNYVFATAVATNVDVLAARPRVTGGVAASFPVGIATLGGSGMGASNNGEGYTDSADRLSEGIPVGGAFLPSAYGPVAVRGLTPAAIVGSLAITGDSIESVTGDNGFMGNTTTGGFLIRAVLNQTSRLYDITKVPAVGHTHLSLPGERGDQFSTSSAQRRRSIAALCTGVYDGYGTNDLANGSAASVVMGTILANAARATSQKQKYTKSTIFPKATGSSDGWSTIAGQLQLSRQQEANRRQLNTWLLKAGGQSAVAAENMLGVYAGNATPASVVANGGDGTAVVFITTQPFVQGTETIRVAGAIKALTTDYTYSGAVTIGGVAYASGVGFLSAPANGATVTAAYTAAAGFKSLAGPLASVHDAAAAVEVNAAGVAGTNGGWWAPAAGSPLVTSTSTGSNTATTLNDTAQAWTQDQWRGYCVLITADATTPASVGQVMNVQRSSATQLLFGASWAATPSSGATYIIYRPKTIDGTHPSTDGAMDIAAATPVTTMV